MAFRGANFGFNSAPKKPTFKFGLSEEDEADEPTFNKNVYRGLSFGEDKPLDKLSKMLEVDQVEEPEEPGNNTPDFAAVQQWMNHLKSVPNRDENKPSGWRRFLNGAAASLAGGSPKEALALNQNLNERPFRNKLEDWANEEAGLEGAAKAEVEQAKLSNTNMDVITRLLNGRSLADYRTGTLANNDKKLKFEQDKFTIEQQTRANELKAKGWQRVNAKGRVLMYNPTTEEERDLGEDKAVTIQDYNSKTSRMNAGTNARNASTNERNVESQIGSRGKRDEIASVTAGTNFIDKVVNRKDKDTTAKDKYVTPSDQGRAEILGVKDAVASNSAWASFVDEDGFPKPPGRWGNQEEYANFLDAVKKNAKKRLSTVYGRDIQDNDLEDDSDVDMDLSEPG